MSRFKVEELSIPVESEQMLSWSATGYLKDVYRARLTIPKQVQDEKLEAILDDRPDYDVVLLEGDDVVLIHQILQPLRFSALLHPGQSDERVAFALQFDFSSVPPSVIAVVTSHDVVGPLVSPDDGTIPMCSIAKGLDLSSCAKSIVALVLHVSDRCNVAKRAEESNTCSVTTDASLRRWEDQVHEALANNTPLPPQIQEVAIRESRRNPSATSLRLLGVCHVAARDVSAASACCDLVEAMSSDADGDSIRRLLALQRAIRCVKSRVTDVSPPSDAASASVAQRVQSEVAAVTGELKSVVVELMRAFDLEAVCPGEGRDAVQQAAECLQLPWTLQYGPAPPPGAIVDLAEMLPLARHSHDISLSERWPTGRRTVLSQHVDALLGVQAVQRLRGEFFSFNVFTASHNKHPHCALVSHSFDAARSQAPTVLRQLYEAHVRAAALQRLTTALHPVLYRVAHDRVVTDRLTGVVALLKKQGDTEAAVDFAVQHLHPRVDDAESLSRWPMRRVTAARCIDDQEQQGNTTTLGIYITPQLLNTL